MNSTIIVAIIVTIGGGLFAILQRVVERRYNKAKEVVEQNSATVVDMLNVVTGFKELNEQYKARIDAQDDEIEKLKIENKELKGGQA